MTSAAVGREDLERQLEVVRALAPGEMEGVFGPDSLTWRIDREALTFLGAGRALLLQLAHPWVAAAIAEHSKTIDDPIGRFHRTFAVVFTMVFGTLDQALSAARALHRRHAAIHGRLPITVGPFRAGSPYQANDLAALRWIYATLVETALMTHDFVLPPLTGEERARYYAESHRFAALFGIPRARFCASSSANGGHGWRSGGLAELGFLVLFEIVHVEVAVGLEPVLMGFDGQGANKAAAGV
jgi:uncharacterized protein (DUF2236 family)